MQIISRREAIRSLAALALGLSFFERVLMTQAVADPALKRRLADWTKELNGVFKDLRLRKITPQQWQRRIEALHKNWDLADILKWIDFEKVKRPVTELPQKGSDVHDVALKKSEKFGSKIFINKRGTAIPPHAHNGLVSAHLVIHGRFHVRTFHRVRDEAGALMLRPSIDRVFSPGDVLSMSDDEDNVHWLVAKTPLAATFDTPMGFIPEGRKYSTPANPYSMIFVDPQGNREGDLIRAKVIDYEEAMAKFG